MAKLATYVHVNRTVYAPGDKPPDEVARKIRNPKAWEGGEVPSVASAEVASDPDDDEGDGGQNGDDEGTGAPENEGQGDGGAPPERPAETAAKEAWVEYVLAVADLDESTVKAMTKPQLIAKAEEADQVE